MSSDRPLVDRLEHLVRRMREHISTQELHDLLDVADGVSSLYASRDFYRAANEAAKTKAERWYRKLERMEREYDNPACRQCIVRKVDGPR